MAGEGFSGDGPAPVASAAEDREASRRFVAQTVEAAIRIAVLLALAAYCLQILRPFLVAVVWGAIIATALHPAYQRLLAVLGDRNKLAAVLFVLLGMVVLLLPTALLSGTAAEAVQAVAGRLSEGDLVVPPVPDEIAGWPLIGEPLHRSWQLANQNLEAALEPLRPHLVGVGRWLLSSVAAAALDVLQFALSIVIAAVMMAHATGGGKVVRTLGRRLAGERGEEFAELAGATVRSVAQGVIGIALLQALLAGVGLMVAGVPGAGLWALLVLIVAVVQLPPLLVLGPIIVYVFATSSTLPAVLFAAWCLAVSLGDAPLKAMLLGRGLSVPTLVILLGAIGGAVSGGIIGLFLGAVVLALSYELVVAWLEAAPPAAG